MAVEEIGEVLRVPEDAEAVIALGQVDAGIKDGDDDILGGRAQVPRLLHADPAQVPL